MTINIKNRLYTGFAVAILLVLLVGIISFSTLQRQHKEAGLVKHSYQVINQLEVLQNVMVDMETGRRGFRSTNEKRFLEPYIAGLKNLTSLKTDLKKLVADNPPQQKRADVLLREVDELLDFWKSLGDDASKYTRERIAAVMAEEKEKMDGIRKHLNEMTQFENSLLVKRERENMKFVNLSKWQLSVGILLILCIVIVLIIQILKEFRNRRVAEESVKKNYKALTIVNQENFERNWLLAGVAKVNDILQGHSDIEKLSQIVLDTVIKYLDVRAGAFYVFDEDNNKLLLTASYALPNSAKKEYNIHEGFVGQAAAEKEPLVISSIPPRFVTIAGATVGVEPVQAIYVSLFHQDELKGIIEVLSFKQVGAQKS